MVLENLGQGRLGLAGLAGFGLCRIFSGRGLGGLRLVGLVGVCVGLCRFLLGLRLVGVCVGFFLELRRLPDFGNEGKKITPTPEGVRATSRRFKP